MKLKIFFLILSCLIHISLGSHWKSKQLFDLAFKEKEPIKKTPKTLLRTYSQNEKLQKQTQSLETLNFSQMKEKTKNDETNELSNIMTSKTEKNIAKTATIKSSSSVSNLSNSKNVASLTNNNTNTNRNKEKTTSSKINSKMDKKAGKKLKKHAKQIENKKKVESDNKLDESLKKSEEKDKMKEKILMFIQNYEKNVVPINNSEKNQSENNQLEKKQEEEYDRLYKETEKKFDHLQNRIQKINKKILKIENNNSQTPNVNTQLKELRVRNSLNVEDSAIIHKLDAESVAIGNGKFEIGTNQIFINHNTNIKIGNEVMNFAKIISNIQSFSKLAEQCGENLEKCQPVPNEFIQEQVSKQQRILESLKHIRKQTSEYLEEKKDFQ